MDSKTAMDLLSNLVNSNPECGCVSISTASAGLTVRYGECTPACTMFNVCQRAGAVEEDAEKDKHFA